MRQGLCLLLFQKKSCIVESDNAVASVPEEVIPRIMLGDLIAREGHVILPRRDFRLISWGIEAAALYFICSLGAVCSKLGR
jgi:hypothetical protein